MRSKLAIGIGAGILVLVAVLAVAFLSAPMDDAVPPAERGLFERPMPWSLDAEAATGTIDSGRAMLAVGALEILAPQPIGAQVRWQHEKRGARQALVGDGKLGENEAKFEWTLADGSPHTVFEGALTAPRGALTETISSSISLPDGELTYVDPSLMRVPFAGTTIELSALTAGPIIWRNGTQTLSLWQWSADRVKLAASESGGFVVQFDWWDPALHEVRDDCAGELAEVQTTIETRLTISFSSAPDAARGRLPGGVTSAVVPIFVDPIRAEDPRIRDAASASAEDYAARARTVALGHSSPKDARHGNGGLVGLEVGGTIVIPTEYSGESQAFEDLRTALSATTIELVQQADLRPEDCATWAAALADPARGLLRESRTFDGKFPNLFGPQQRSSIPGFVGGAVTWQATALTGRRKDVVTQALSSTYLSRLADARGLAVLEIPIVATRNPLVAAAAESLLEPERAGHWTIQEDLARSLGEVELLSEDDRFDFVGLGRLTRYTRGASDIVFDEVGDGTWLVHNDGDAAVEGYTLALGGAVTATVDGEPVESATRTLGNGDAQTWIWWDVEPGATYTLGVTLAESPARTGVNWRVAP